jgi:hypothetical protein
MYLDSPISIVLPTSLWPKIEVEGVPIIGQVHNDGVYRLQKEVMTGWAYTNADQRRHRYIYRFVTDTGLTFATLKGTWGSIGPYWWPGITLTDGGTGWRIESWQRDYASISALLDELYVPAANREPQTVTLECAIDEKYQIFKQDQQKLIGFWVDIGGLQDMGTVNYVLTQTQQFNIMDYPQPDVKFVEAECGATPGHVHGGDDIITFTLTWENSYVPNHDTYSWSVVAWAVPGAIAIYHGIIPAGSTGKQRGTFNFKARELLNRGPVAGETITLGCYAYRGATYLPDSVTSYIGISVAAAALPSPDPVIVAEMCSYSVTQYQETAPTDPVGFHIVLEKRTTGHDQYPTSTAWLASVCKGHVKLLWTGAFAAGSPEATRVALDFSLTPEDLAGGSFTAQEYVNVYFFTGNGAAFISGLAYGFAPTLAVVPPVSDHVGTIRVTSDRPGAPFILSGAASYSGTTPWLNANAPVGGYCIDWGEVDGYTKPSRTCLSLSEGTTIQFNGLYESGGGNGGGGSQDNKIPLYALAVGGAALVGWSLTRRK